MFGVLGIHRDTPDLGLMHELDMQYLDFQNADLKTSHNDTSLDAVINDWTYSNVRHKVGADSVQAATHYDDDKRRHDAYSQAR